MQIGVFINNEWIPGILNSNHQGLIIKTEKSSFIVNFKEIISCRINNQNFIELFYITMKNAETVKTRITINSEDINKTYQMMTTVPVDEVVDPKDRFKAVEKEEIKHTQEFIDKQKELTDSNVLPAKKIPPLVIGVITLVIVVLGFCIFKNMSLNTKSNLKTFLWSNQTTGNDYFTYEFLEDDKCRYSHQTESGKVIDECTYKLKNNTVEIKFENNEVTKYKWKISYKLINFELRKKLTLNNEIYYSQEI